MVAVAAGARRSEIFYLRWEQIDLPRAIPTISKQRDFRVKEGRDKVLPIPAFLVHYLEVERKEFRIRYGCWRTGKVNSPMPAHMALPLRFAGISRRSKFGHGGANPLMRFGQNGSLIGFAKVLTWLQSSGERDTGGWIQLPDISRNRMRTCAVQLKTWIGIGAKLARLKSAYHNYLIILTECMARQQACHAGGRGCESRRPRFYSGTLEFPSSHFFGCRWRAPALPPLYQCEVGGQAGRNFPGVPPTAR